MVLWKITVPTVSSLPRQTRSPELWMSLGRPCVDLDEEVVAGLFEAEVEVGGLVAGDDRYLGFGTPTVAGFTSPTSGVPLTWT